MSLNTSIDLKIVVLGSTSVGKTALINRYCNGTFQPDTLNTIGAGFFTHNITLNGFDVTLLLWDTAGEERFRSVAPSLLRGANGLILVFDVSQPSTFNDLTFYYEMFLDVVSVDMSSKLPILLLGNKIDLEKFEITESQIENWCNKNRISLKYLVSAKNGINVEESFTKLVSSLLKPTSNIPKPSIQIQLEKNKKSNCC